MLVVNLFKVKGLLMALQIAFLYLFQQFMKLSLIDPSEDSHFLISLKYHLEIFFSQFLKCIALVSKSSSSSPS
jgi:hypothetical protein